MAPKCSSADITPIMVDGKVITTITPYGNDQGVKWHEIDLTVEKPEALSLATDG